MNLALTPSLPLQAPISPSPALELWDFRRGARSVVEKKIALGGNQRNSAGRWKVRAGGEGLEGLSPAGQPAGP